MACQNKDYNAIKDFKVVSYIVESNPNWQSWILNRYKSEVAKELIKLIENGTFTEDYGREGFKQILSKKDSLTNDTDVTQLHSRYRGGLGDSIGFKRITVNFRKELIGRILIDPETNSMVNANEVLPSGITVVNQRLFDFKMELLQTLWNKLFEGQPLNLEYTSDEDFNKLLTKVCTTFARDVLFKPSELKPLWDTYFQLRYFDQLLVDFSDFVTIKPEWNNSGRKGIDMYEYRGPYVKYDTSFNPDEFASAEQYASAYLQAILDYFTKVELDGKPSTEAITFDGFNAAICDLKDFLSSYNLSSLRLELYKGQNTNWDKLIDKYCGRVGARPETVKTLRGIQKLLGSNSDLDNKIKQVLQQQVNRIVRYEFVGIRKSYDSNLKRNVITEIRLKDSKIDKLKVGIAKSIRYRVWKSRLNSEDYTKFKKSLSIKLDESNKEIRLVGYGKNNEDLIITPNITNGLYDFDFKLVGENGTVESINEATLNMEKFRTLVENLFQTKLPDSYRNVLNVQNEQGVITFPLHNLFDVFKDAVALTLAASEIDVFKFSFRLNGNELELPGAYFRGLDTPATFLGLVNGILDETRSKNGLGNDLPNYQTISAVHQAQEMIDLARTNYDQFRRSRHKASGILHTIHEKSILNTAENESPVLGKATVKADYDADGRNKNSASMNFNELNYFEMFKHYYRNLKKDGKILLQSTCLSDKHTHWLIEYFTTNAKFLNGDIARNILISLTSGNKKDRDSAERSILSEIKARREHVTRVEIINMLNRYQDGLGLTLTDFNATYDDIVTAITTLHDEFKKYNSTEEIFAKLKEKEVDFLPEADLIVLDGNIYLNETLLHHVKLYMNPVSDSDFKQHIQRSMMLHARKLFKNHFKIDAVLDPGLQGIINRFRSEMLPDEFNSWYNSTAQTMKAFRLFDENENEVIPNYTQEGLSYFDHTKYTVELNPVLLSHFYADALFSRSFNDVVFGADYGLESKYIKKQNNAIDRVNNAIKSNKQDLKTAEIERDSLKAKIASENNDIKRFELKAQLTTVLANITTLKNKQRELIEQYNTLIDPWNDEFAYKSEASRLAMHYKRTVHGGATYTPLNQNMRYGVNSKVKTAVIQDTKIPVYSVGGHRDTFVSQDGAGHSSPYFSRMCNNSYVDGAVGVNKKTIFSFVDPETGVLDLIKWAEYEITNSIRRDSPRSLDHASYEIMFEKMHSFILSSLTFNNFDVQNYYSVEDIRPGAHSTPLYFSSADGKQHFKILSITNNGNSFTRTIIETDANGNILAGAIPEVEKPVIVNTIYQLDQLFGGAYVEELQDGTLDYSEVQNDIVFKMICDLGIKDEMIGICVNASAIKSGQRNNNPNNIFFKNNVDSLTYFEMSTRFGGAQMNADHVLGDEMKVTEMSQMISALVQNGKRIGQVNKIYEFIGMVAREELGDLVEMTDNPERELELYRWLGDAVVRAFQSQSTDTLGLAGAFITRAQRSLDRHGFKTKIPFSATTVKGVFESAIASFINNHGIHRKFPGGGFVQMPTFDEKLRYNYGGNNYSYTELIQTILNESKFVNSGMTLESVFEDYKSLNTDGTGFKNPYIEKLDENGIRSLEEGDTVILYDNDDFGKIIPESIEKRNLDKFEDYDYVRNLTSKNVAKWTIQPKNLLGPRTHYTVSHDGVNVEYSIYDLDSARVMQYAQMLLDGDKMYDEAIEFLKNYATNQVYFGNTYVSQIIEDLASDNKMQRDLAKDRLKELKLWATRQFKKDLNIISKKGELDAQISWNSKADKGIVVSHRYQGSQVLIGRKDAERFGIKNRHDLLAAQTKPQEFFRRSLGYLASKPKTSSVPTYAYDGAIHDTSGNTILLVVDEINDGKILSGTSTNPEYSKDSLGHIYKDDEDLGYHHGIEFLTYSGLDGQSYTVLHANTMQDFLSFYNKTKLYSNWVPNANSQNWKRLSRYVRNTRVDARGNVTYISKNEDGTEEPFKITSPEELNNWIRTDVGNDINLLAKQRAAAWKAYQKGIGTRIPAQSMQSFTPCDIIGFTDYDTNGIHIGTKLMWIQGSDLDIDKLYFMMYGFTEDGLLPTFSDLDQIFNAEKCLDLPKPSKRKFDIVVANDSIELQNAINQGYRRINGNGFELIENILNQDDLHIVVLQSDIENGDWSTYLYDSDTIIDIQKFVDLHENSERSGSLRQTALKNVVVRRILNLLSDPVNQYSLEFPISTDAANKAAENSEAGRDEEYLNADVPSDKYGMQIANMVGRDDIGIGASSLKAYFGASTYFNTLVNGAIEQIENFKVTGNLDTDSLWRKIKNCMFNTKFSEKAICTFANINFEDLLEVIPDDMVITVSDLGLTTGVNDAIANLGEDIINGNSINLYNLISLLNDAANGKWDSSIDAAASLSEFITISTDNAKMLVLAKINAGTAFADIYTYLLSVGESFETIADFMTSPIFYIVADYIDSNVMESLTGIWDLERVIKFVLDESTLPNIDENIWNRIITTFDQDSGEYGGFINRLLYNRSETGENFRRNLLLEFGIEDNRELFEFIANNIYDDEIRQKLINEAMKALNTTTGQNLLSEYLLTRIGSAVSTYDSNVYDNYNESNYDEEFEDAVDEEDLARSYDTTLSDMSKEDWTKYYKYLHEYLIPKNQAMSEVVKKDKSREEKDRDVTKLKLLKERVLPALKEQRMLAKILGINQGLETKDFDEYKWIRDIESFINQRYIDNNITGDPDLEFNLMRFLNDEAYRKKQIDFYDKVKSTYNILEVITTVPHFWEMFKFVGTNRKNLEKAVVFKVTRRLADTILKVNKPVSDNGLSKGLSQKLNDKEYRVIQSAAADIITRNWFRSLDGLRINIPKNEGIKTYKGGVLSLANESSIPLNNADGLASFKWLVENYIVPKLKEKYGGKNAFIDALQLTYSRNLTGNDVIEYLTLPFSLVNSTKNIELENRLTAYKDGFNAIYKENSGIDGWTIGDIMYLYNLYVFKDGFGRDSMTRIFEDMVIEDENDSTIASEYLNYLRRIDSGIESISVIDEISNLENLDNLDINDDSEAVKVLNDVRMLMVFQPTNGSKFRVQLKTIGDRSVINLLDKDYHVPAGWIGIPVENLTRSDYKFALLSWDPIVIKSDVLPDFVRRKSLDKTHYKVNGKDAVRIAVRTIQRKFDSKVPIQLITKSFLENEASNWGIDSSATGFIRNGIIYIVEDHENIRASTPVHELMHIICASLKYSDNLEQRHLYYDLLQAVNDLRNWNPYVQDFIKNIRKRYEGYAVGSDLQEEVLVEVLASVFQNKFYKTLSKNKLSATSQLSNLTFAEFESRISRAVEDVFDIPSSTLDPTRGHDFRYMDMSLADIMLNLMSNLVDANTNEILLSQIPLNQQLANLKRRLVENDSDPEAKDWLTFNGNC